MRHQHTRIYLGSPKLILILVRVGLGAGDVMSVDAFLGV